MKTPTLKTPRVTLRPLQVSDAEEIYANWTTDPDVSKYTRWNTHESLGVTVDWLESINPDDEKSYEFGFVYNETSRLFGSGGLYWNDKHDMFELGYVLMKAAWGKGLATEAARAICDFGISTLQQRQLFACRAKENLASGKVLEKLGFIYHGDGTFNSYDGKTIFEGREYFLG